MPKLIIYVPFLAAGIAEGKRGILLAAGICGLLEIGIRLYEFSERPRNHVKEYEK